MFEDNALNLMREIESGVARSKIGYWKEAGMALLGNDDLGEKWCEFVESQANDFFKRGLLLDETLQIISMIKANVPFKAISQVIGFIQNGQIILDEYLGMFVRPEILNEINSNVNKKRK